MFGRWISKIWLRWIVLPPRIEFSTNQVSSFDWNPLTTYARSPVVKHFPVQGNKLILTYLINHPIVFDLLNFVVGLLLLFNYYQGLDPRCTANLFLDAECVGENTIDNEVCFMLRLQTEQHILQAQSTSNTEIIMHTILGYFSQRTGLLVKFEDTKLVRMKPVKGKDSVFWETSIDSTIGDYRCIDGINIAHSGKTVATLYRYGAAQNHKRMIEEIWKIEEVDFNIFGLSMDCFLPPSDLEREHDGAEHAVGMS